MLLEEKREAFKKKHIASVAECGSFENYLENLSYALELREVPKELYADWNMIFASDFMETEWKQLLQEYKEALQKKIEEAHDLLQNMELEEYAKAVSMGDWDRFPASYRYELEKVKNLNPNAKKKDVDEQTADESYWADFDPMQSLDDLEGDWEEESDMSGVLPEECHILEEEMTNLRQIQEIIGKTYGHPLTTEQQVVLRLQLEMNYHPSESDWGRIMLMFLEEFYPEKGKLDYTLDDWHLYLLFLMQEWARMEN